MVLAQILEMHSCSDTRERQLHQPNPSEIFDKLTLGAAGPRKQRLDQEWPNIRAQGRQILRLKLR